MLLQQGVQVGEQVEGRQGGAGNRDPCILLEHMEMEMRVAMQGGIRGRH